MTIAATCHLSYLSNCVCGCGHGGGWGVGVCGWSADTMTQHVMFQIKIYDHKHALLPEFTEQTRQSGSRVCAVLEGDAGGQSRKGGVIMNLGGAGRNCAG